MLAGRCPSSRQGGSVTLSPSASVVRRVAGTSSGHAGSQRSDLGKQAVPAVGDTGIENVSSTKADQAK